jgi:hypothetical protein
MKNKDINLPLLQGDSLISRFTGFGSLGIVAFMLLGIALGGKISGILVSIIGITLIIWYIRSKLVQTVNLLEDEIEVKYFLKKKKTKITYSSVTKLYCNKQPYIQTHLYVLICNHNEKKMKVTFFCEKQDFKQVYEPWFIEKEITVSERWKKHR